MGFQLKRLALFFRECFVHLMFLIISFPRASKKPEDQQVSVLSDAQANTGRVSICLFFVVLVVPGASEQMYLYQIWLGFSDQKKKVAFFVVFPVESAEDYSSALLKYFRRKREKEVGRGKAQYFLDMSVS